MISNQQGIGQISETSSQQIESSPTLIQAPHGSIKQSRNVFMNRDQFGLRLSSKHNAVKNIDINPLESNQYKQNLDEQNQVVSNYSNKKLNQTASLPKKENKRNLQEEQDRHIDAFAKFNLGVFFEILFYHLLQNYLLGPFLKQVMQIKNPTTSLYKNMMMSPGLDKVTFIQNSMWLANVTLIVIFFLNQDMMNLESEIIFSQIFLILRCIIIASRYGNFGVEKMIIYRTVDLRINQLTRDFYLGEWTQQTKRIIYNEITSTIERHEIDKQLFFFQFLVDPHINTAERLVQHSLDIEEFHLSYTEFEPKSLVFTDDIIQFYGYSIFAEFIEIFNRRIKKFKRRIKYFTLLFCSVNILIPIIQRYRDNRLEWNLYSAILIPEAFLIFTNGYIVVTYNLIGIVDLLRKIFLLGQCANLISAQKKLELSDVKTLPTINIFCWANLKAWNILRAICFEYGYNYFLRAQILFTVQISIVILVVLAFLLNAVNVITLDGIFVQLFFLSFSCTFVVSLLMLYCAAQINGYFDTFKNLLCENLLFISSLNRLRKIYHQEGLEPRNYLQKRGLSVIKQCAAKQQIDTGAVYKQLKKGYNEALEGLSVQAQNPFTIMGIEINNGIFSSYIITLGSIFSTIIGQIIMNMMNQTQ